MRTNEQHDRKQKEDRGERVGNRRLQDARRDQEIEQQDDREREHEIGEERQERVDAAAEISRGKAERDAQRQGEQGRQGSDHQDDAAAGDDAGEHVAREPVAAEQIGKPGGGLDGARQRVLHFRDLPERVEQHDPFGEDRREQPEADQQQTREPGSGFEDLPVEAELATERQARAQDDRQTQPDRKQLIERAQRDLKRVEELHYCTRMRGLR